MGFIKDRNFKSKIPNDLGVSTENLDFNLLMGDIVQAIDITIKQYAQHKNNSIYVRFHANAIEKLGLHHDDSVMITFNKSFTRFGIRKDTRGIKVKGTNKLLSLQTSNKLFNQFDLDTEWYALYDDIVKATDGNYFTTDVFQDSSLLEQIKDDKAWKNFVESME